MDPAHEIVQPEEKPQSAVVARPRMEHNIPAVWKWLTYVLMLPLVALATIFFGALSLLAGLWDKDGSQQHWIARQWARSLLIVALSPVKVEGMERLQALRGKDTRNPNSRRPLAVYASNHLSYYDTPVVFATLPFQFRILAKAPLWKIPFIGWYLQRSGQVPVDQSSARSAITSLARGVKTLESGLPLMVFPEGGRAWNGELQKMVSGAAWMAIRAQVPLVPLTLVGTYELLPIHVYSLRPRPLKLIVGEPIPTTGLTTKDADALTQRMREVISQTFMSESAR